MKISLKQQETQNIFFISDTHFFHKNVIKYDNRPFASIQEHDEAIVNNWNETVGPNDFIFFLGDFFFGRWQDCKDLYYKLNGKKTFLKGNHDKAFYEFLKKKAGQNDTKEDWKEYHSYNSYGEVRIEDSDTPRGWQDIIMCHYPIAEFNKGHYGSWHIFGHTHQNSWYDRDIATKRKCINVGACCREINYKPISYDRIKEIFKKEGRENIIHH